MRYVHVRRALAATVAAALFAAAGCSDDDSSSEAPSSEAATSESSSSSESSGSSAAAESSPSSVGSSGTTVASADGEPITIGFFNAEGSATSTFNTPEVTIGAQAAARYVNEQLGGINGRPIELVTCASMSTAEGMTNCANTFVDAEVDAVLKGVEGQSAAGIPIILGAGIPYLAQVPVSPPELASQGAFGFTTGGIGNFVSLAEAARINGYKSVVFAYIDTPSVAAAVETYVEPAFRNAGATSFTAVPLSTTASDFAPQASQALNAAPDLLAISATPPGCLGILNALRGIASEMPPVAYVNSCESPQFLDVIESIDSRRFVASNTTSFDLTDADTAVMYEQVDKFAPDEGVHGFMSVGFSGIMDVYAVLSTVDDPSSLDAAGITEAFEAARDVPLFMGGGAVMTCDGQQMPQLTSVCSSQNLLAEYLGNDSYGDPIVVDVQSLLT